MAITDPRATNASSGASQNQAFIDLHANRWVNYGSIADAAATAAALRFSKLDGVFLVEYTSETKNGSFTFKATGVGTGTSETLSLLNAHPVADVDVTNLSAANVVEADATLVVDNATGGTAFAATAGDIAPCIDTDTGEIGIINDLGVAVAVRIMRLGYSE